MALEAGDVPVAGAGSQLGWLLWADALEPEAAAAAAARLSEPDILTAYGLRTLAASEPGFAPAAYHRGAVWPFDSWLGWGGLRAAGRTAEAERVRTGRAGGARPARPRPGALRGGAAMASLAPIRWRTGPGMDDRRALGARARRLGRTSGRILDR